MKPHQTNEKVIFVQTKNELNPINLKMNILLLR